MTVTVLLEDVPFSGNVLINDSGSPVGHSNQRETPPSVGQISRHGARHPVLLLTDGTFLYAPGAPLPTPSDSFTYTISDAHGGTATATVTIAINQYSGVAATSGGVLHIGGTSDRRPVTVSGGNLILNGIHLQR